MTNKDVDVKLLRAEHEKGRKGDAEMIDADQNVSQETSYEQVVEDVHVTLTSSQKTESSKQSSSVSSNFASKFLNFDNVPPVDTDVASLLKIKGHNEEPSSRTSSHFTIHISSSASTTTTLLSVTPLLQQSNTTLAPTTESTTSLIFVLPDFYQRVSALEMELSQVKQVNHSTQILAQIPAIVDEHLSTRIGFATQTTLQSYMVEFEKKAQAEKEKL
ncbi:hypothetical protein Tco_1451661 [Tanacetum coccineum]